MPLASLTLPQVRCNGVSSWIFYLSTYQFEKTAKVLLFRIYCLFIKFQWTHVLAKVSTWFSKGLLLAATYQAGQGLWRPCVNRKQVWLLACWSILYNCASTSPRPAQVSCVHPPPSSNTLLHQIESFHSALRFKDYVLLKVERFRKSFPKC